MHWNLLLVPHHYENLCRLLLHNILFQSLDIFHFIQVPYQIIFSCYSWLYSRFYYIFSSNSSSFIEKDIYFVSSKSLLYALTFGRIIHNGVTFLSPLWYHLKFLKQLLSKGTLLDTIILLIFTSQIKIGLSCWWNLCFPTSILSNVITSFPIFINEKKFSCFVVSNFLRF